MPSSVTFALPPQTLLGFILVIRDTWGPHHHCPDVQGEEPQLTKSTVSRSSPARWLPLLESTPGTPGAVRTATRPRGISDLKTLSGYRSLHTSGNLDTSGTTGTIILYNSITAFSLKARLVIAGIVFPTQMHYIPIQYPLCLSVCLRSDSFCSNFRPEQLSLLTPPHPRKNPKLG